MSELLKTSSARRFLLFILMFLIFTGLSIFLNVPILRQVLGFTFLTVIPGLLILHILKLKKLEVTQKIVLSVGLSISFLMFLGLFINWVYPLFGYNTPLSTNPLTISFSVILVILAIIAYVRNRNASFANLSDLKSNTKEKTFLLVPAFFPLLSILGVYLMNSTDNNVMLMVLLFLIPAYAIFITVKHDQVPERVYPPIIFLAGISLVLMFGLRSNHIIGFDVHSEYKLFQQTFNNGYWQMLTASILNSSLSISILPTVYQSFLNINPEYLFKILYPVLFSLSPLVVYLLSRKYIGSHYAFLAAFFFMSQRTFLQTAANPRTTVAILFFALSIAVLFSGRLNEFSKRLLFIVFAASVIFSHYSTAYIFFFIILLIWIGMQVIPRIISLQRKPALSPNPSRGDGPSNSTNQNGAREIPQPRLRTYMGFGIVILFLTILFVWYSQLTVQPFESGVSFIVNTFRSLQGFFVMESRGSEVAALLGVELQTKGIAHHIEFVFSWLTIALIAIGVLTTLGRARLMVAFSGEEKETQPFLNQRIDAEFFVLSLGCSAMLASAITLPFVLVGYSMDRLYCQTMIVLSPFVVIGGIMVAKFLHSKWMYLVVLIVIIPYFICSTGTVYQMFGVPRGVTLTSEGRSYEMLFIHDQETFCARWLNDHAHESARIYADVNGVTRLRTQGGIRSAVYVDALIEDSQTIDGYVFLIYHNVVEGKLVDRQYRSHDMANYQDGLTEKAKIYVNGASEVYR